MRTSTNSPAPAARAAVDERRERVAAEQRVDGERIGAEAGDRAERRRRLAEERLGVRGGADVDVAALGVGDDEQPGVPGSSDDLGERRPAGRPEPLEARDLRT